MTVDLPALPPEDQEESELQLDESDDQEDLHESEDQEDPTTTL